MFKDWNDKQDDIKPFKCARSTKPPATTAAQEKEELQRYGDELDGKINKCQKELQALKNTLEHLKKRNRNVREKFTEGVVKADVEKKEKGGDKKKEYELRKYLEDTETVINAKKKMIELEKAAEKAILQMMKEIEAEK